MYNHIVLKLVSGEYVLARLEQETEYDFLLEHPTVVSTQADSLTGYVHIYLSPLNPFNQAETITFLQKKHIIFNASMDKEYSEYYEAYLLKRKLKEEVKYIVQDNIIDKFDGIYPASSNTVN